MAKVTTVLRAQRKQGVHSGDGGMQHGVIMSALLDFLTPASQKRRLKVPGEGSGGGICLGSDLLLLPPRNLRSLQRFQGEPDGDRIEFMERHASLVPKCLGVIVEQVSMFLNPDNTVISFFQASAEDVETPILRRLNSSETLLRQSCDASMIVHPIQDFVTDLSLPVTAAYQDALETWS